MKVKAILSVACMLAIATSVAGQKKYDIKLNLKPGQKVELVTVSHMPMNMTVAGQATNMVMDMTQAARVEALSKEGSNTKLSVQNTKLTMNISMPAMGINQIVSSDDEMDFEENAMFKAMISAPIIVTVNPNGRIVGKLDNKQLLENLSKVLPEGVGIDMFERVAENMAKIPFGGIELPTKPIAIGESWNTKFVFSFDISNASSADLQNDLKLTLKGVTNKHYILDGVSDLTVTTQGIEMKGKMTGVYTLDRISGIISTIDAKLEMAGEGEFSPGQSYSIKSSGTMKVSSKQAS